MKIQIEYCAEWGYEPQAVRLTEEIIKGMEYGTLTSVTLIPSEGGVFEVTLNGELIHSKANSGKFPSQGAILEKLKQYVASD